MKNQEDVESIIKYLNQVSPFFKHKEILNYLRELDTQ